MVSVSFAHYINVSLVNGLEEANAKGEEGTRFKFWLLFLTGVFGGLSIFWIVECFLNNLNEWYTIIIIIITLVLGVGLTILSISNIVTRKRLLTSIYMFSFISYLCWSALNSQPNNKSFKINFWDIMIGVVYLFIALSFIGFYVKKAEVPQNIDSKENEAEKALQKNPIIETEKKK